MAHGRTAKQCMRIVPRCRARAHTCPYHIDAHHVLDPLSTMQSHSHTHAHRLPAAPRTAHPLPRLALCLPLSAPGQALPRKLCTSCLQSHTATYTQSSHCPAHCSSPAQAGPPSVAVSTRGQAVPPLRTVHVPSSPHTCCLGAIITG